MNAAIRISKRAFYRAQELYDSMQNWLRKLHLKFPNQLIKLWKNSLLLFSIFVIKNFWHWVNFKLQYLGSQLSDRKVIICILKVCSGSFQISPYFCDFDNFKGSYRHLKISSPFLGTHCRIEVNSSELKISVNPEDR